MYCNINGFHQQSFTYDTIFFYSSFNKIYRLVALSAIAEKCCYFHPLSIICYVQNVASSMLLCRTTHKNPNRRFFPTDKRLDAKLKSKAICCMELKNALSVSPYCSTAIYLSICFIVVVVVERLLFPSRNHRTCREFDKRDNGSAFLRQYRFSIPFEYIIAA